MGTSDKPSSFSGRNGRSGVGMTANPAGFASGQTLTIDFFLPGCPEEGFYFGYGGSASSKNNADPSTVRVWTDGDEAKAEYSAELSGVLECKQEFTLGVDHTFFRNDIKLTNKGSSTLTNVRFMRSHDPDNTVDQGGSYSTHQIKEDVTEPPGASAVSATSRAGDRYYTNNGNKAAKVLYYTKDPKGVTTYGSSALAPRGLFSADVYDSPKAVG